MATIRKQLADGISDIIEKKLKPLIEENGISFICSIDGALHMGAEDNDALKEEVLNMFRGMIKTGFVTKDELKKLISEV